MISDKSHKTKTTIEIKMINLWNSSQIRKNSKALNHHMTCQKSPRRWHYRQCVVFLMKWNFFGKVNKKCTCFVYFSYTNLMVLLWIPCMYVWLVYINQWHCTIGTNETNIILVCIFALSKDVFKFIILISIVVFVLWDLSDIIEEVIYRHTNHTYIHGIQSKTIRLVYEK
jgi:hypothetical protein